MADYVNIAALADEVLASVAVPPSVKTASAPIVHHTELAKSIKLAAEKIRNYADAAITDQDVIELLSGLRKQADVGTTGAMMGAMSGSPAGAAMGGGITNPINRSAPGPAPSNPTGQVAPKLAHSVAGDMLRKLATAVRAHGEQQEEARLIKAAQMVVAATGLKHLQSALKR